LSGKRQEQHVASGQVGAIRKCAPQIGLYQGTGPALSGGGERSEKVRSRMIACGLRLLCLPARYKNVTRKPASGVETVFPRDAPSRTEAPRERYQLPEKLGAQVRDRLRCRFALASPVPNTAAASPARDIWTASGTFPKQNTRPPRVSQMNLCHSRNQAPGGRETV